MKQLAWLLPVAALGACGGNGSTTTTTGTGGTNITGTGGATSTTSTAGTGGTTGTLSTTSAGGGSTTSTGGGSTTGTGGAASSSSTAGTSSTTSSSSGMPCGVCPTGYTCGTANGLPVCRAASGIPLFSHVFLILMENTSLSTLESAMTGGTAPNLSSYATKYATATNYHGVAHPSLPNYIAITSGSTQNTVCDCDATPGGDSCPSDGTLCTALLAVSSCTCQNNAMNLADQIEAAGRTWMSWAESMGTPCNTTDSGNYAQRHVPFLYYEDIDSSATQARCTSHIVDFSNFSPDNAASFNFITPNLIDDMHNPNPAIEPTTVNIPNGDAWLGMQVPPILASSKYTQGGLLVIVWDEDDLSGDAFDPDDPIGIFVMSPYAKANGYTSSVLSNHYTLLATIEDGLGLPYLAMAASPGSGVAGTLVDFFPDN